MLHSSGHLLLSLVNPSNTLDQYTVTIDDLNYSSGVVISDQKRDEQTMDSLQPRDQVVNKRAEPDEESAADSSMVRCRSDHPGEFIVPLDDPNEEITEQWQDGLHDWYTCRDDQCSVKSDRVSTGSCLKRRSVCARRNSQMSTPRECDSHRTSWGPVVVHPHKPSVVAWCQRCFRESHLLGVPSPRKMGLNEPDPHSRNFQSSNEWCSRGGQNCNDGKDDVFLCADGGSNVLLGPRGACVSCG